MIIADCIQLTTILAVFWQWNTPPLEQLPIKTNAVVMGCQHLMGWQTREKKRRSMCSCNTQNDHQVHSHHKAWVGITTNQIRNKSQARRSLPNSITGAKKSPDKNYKDLNLWLNIWKFPFQTKSQWDWSHVRSQVELISSSSSQICFCFLLSLCQTELMKCYKKQTTGGVFLSMRDYTAKCVIYVCTSKSQVLSPKFESLFIAKY